jgi:hypothetical protein
MPPISEKCKNCKKFLDAFETVICRCGNKYCYDCTISHNVVSFSAYGIKTCIYCFDRQQIPSINYFLNRLQI